jgi:hypothetical protein
MKRLAFFLPLLASLSLGGIHAAEIHVAPDGDDANPGSMEKPMKTIQAAVDRMKAGDTCLIRGGTYRESVKIRVSGEPGKPVRIAAYPGEEVVLDGTDVAAGPWTRHQGSIYKTRLPKGVEQVFIGRDMMIEARWPNMGFHQIFDRSRWAGTDEGSWHGLLVSKAVAETGVDWTGAMACLNVAHQWWTWNRPILRHEAGSGRLEYAANLVGLCQDDPDLYEADDGEDNFIRSFHKDRDSLKRAWENDYFYLFGKLEALDVENEWFQDPESGEFYFHAPGGVDPSTLEVRHKVRDIAVHAQGRQHLEIIGIRFFATTFQLDDCNHCLVENCELLYPSYTRTITEYDEDRRESVFTKITGDHNTVRRCALAYANNLGLMTMGNSNLVENCIIHDVNWFGTLIYPALQLSASPRLGVNWFDTIQYPPTERTFENTDATSYGNVARRNTLYNCGNSLLVYHAANSIVEYNHVHDGGRACKDVSLIYGCWPFSRGSVVRYNWVHGCRTGSHGGLGIRADDQSRNNYFHHNVVWDCGGVGIVIKGEDNRVFNNTVFDIGTPEKPEICLKLPVDAEPIKVFAVQWPQLLRQNQWSFVKNNALHLITGQYGATGKFGLVVADSDRIKHNHRKPDVRSFLRDPDNFDFRPKEGSPLVDAGVEVPGYTDGFKGAAPDLGAYEAGGEWWKPGADWKESFTLLEKPD